MWFFLFFQTPLGGRRSRCDLCIPEAKRGRRTWPCNGYSFKLLLFAVLGCDDPFEVKWKVMLITGGGMLVSEQSLFLISAEELLSWSTYII